MGKERKGNKFFLPNLPEPKKDVSWGRKTVEGFAFRSVELEVSICISHGSSPTQMLVMGSAWALSHVRAIQPLEGWANVN